MSKKDKGKLSQPDFCWCCAFGVDFYWFMCLLEVISDNLSAPIESLLIISLLHASLKLMPRSASAKDSHPFSLKP